MLSLFFTSGSLKGTLFFLRLLRWSGGGVLEKKWSIIVSDHRQLWSDSTWESAAERKTHFGTRKRCKIKPEASCGPVETTGEPGGHGHVTPAA